MSKLLSKTEPALTTQPKRKSSGQTPAVKATPNVTEVLLQSLTNRSRVFSDQLAHSRRRPSEKAIHDLRVATRRLIATLDVLRTVPVCNGAGLTRTRKQLKQILDALSSMRDIQVQVIAVSRLVTKFPVLSLFLTILLFREKSAKERFKSRGAAITGTVAKDGRLESIGQGIVDEESRLQSLAANSVLSKAACEVVLGTLAKSFMRAASLIPAAMTGKSTRIHRLRIAFKKFRYTVEALQPILPGVTPQTLKAMNAYQVRMGNVQDIDVLISEVETYARRHRRADPIQFQRLEERLMNRRKELAEHFLRSAGELETFWYKISRPAYSVLKET